jgi:hypothetical protein
VRLWGPVSAFCDSQLGSDVLPFERRFLTAKNTNDQHYATAFWLG